MTTYCKNYLYCTTKTFLRQNLLKAGALPSNLAAYLYPENAFLDIFRLYGWLLPALLIGHGRPPTLHDTGNNRVLRQTVQTDKCCSPWRNGESKAPRQSCCPVKTSTCLPVVQWSAPQPAKTAPSSRSWRENQHKQLKPVPGSPRGPFSSLTVHSSAYPHHM